MSEPVKIERKKAGAPRGSGENGYLFLGIWGKLPNSGNFLSAGLRQGCFLKVSEPEVHRCGEFGSGEHSPLVIILWELGSKLVVWGI